MDVAGHVWAVVLHYRLWRETVQCVQSLLASTCEDLRVLVVDNGSDEASRAELLQHLDPRAEILTLPDNRRYAGGMNAGLKWALSQGADWVLALNNDTFVAPDMVERLVQTAAADPEIGIVAPVICLAINPERVWNAGARRRPYWPLARQLWQGCPLPDSEVDPFCVDYITGCALLASRAVLEQVGLFDPRYIMYYEDADFCERVNNAGYRILVDPNARMWHLVGRTTAQEPAPNRYHGVRNRWRFYMEHRAGVNRAIAVLLLIGQEGLRGLGYAVTGQGALARAQWTGLRDAMRGTQRDAMRDTVRNTQHDTSRHAHREVQDDHG